MTFQDVIKVLKNKMKGEVIPSSFDIFIPKYFEVADKTNVDDYGFAKMFYRINDCYAVGMTAEEENELIDFLCTNYYYNNVLVELQHVYRKEHIITGRNYKFDFLVRKGYNLYEVIVDRKYVIYFEHFTKDNSKNFEGIKPVSKVKSSGLASMQEINELGRQKGLWKETMGQYFADSSLSKKYKHMLKLCVPNQIGWITPKREVAINHCFKADVSSAFPSQLTLRVPILRNVKVVAGDTTPTDSYPFVFTFTPGQLFGRVQILETDGTYIDTDVDLNNKFMSEVKLQLRISDTRLQYLKGVYTENNKSYHITLPEEKTSICCPVSKVSLKAIMETLYQVKLNGKTPEEIQKAKDTMNSFIGYCQINTDPRLAFISAVVIARQNHSMLEKCRLLESEGNQILYIATDSIVWRGDDSNIAVSEKFLGSFTREYVNCKFYGIQVGAYQIETEEGKTINWATYLENTEEKKNMAFGTLPQPKIRRI